MERRSFLGGLLALAGFGSLRAASGKVGISGPIIGRHFDTVIVDDPYTATDVLKDRQAAWYDEITEIHSQRLDSSCAANKRTLRNICARMNMEQRLAPEPYR